MKKLPFFIFFVFFFFLSFLGVRQAEANQTNTPTIIEMGPKEGEHFFDRFYIKGLTPANTEVLVYIDGNYVGEADVSSENTDSDNFYYENLEVFSRDSCWVKLIAKDKTSLVLSAPVEVQYFFPSLPAPTLITPAKENILGNPKPIITGLSATQSFVHIYIDGTYNGRTALLSHNSGTANFSYKPFLNLKPGPHQVQAVAEDSRGRKSKISEILRFKIEEPMPAPTLFTPVISQNSSPSQPFIIGLAKNDSFVKIYVDHKLSGQFLVKNNESGVANFAYKQVEPLTRGNHLIYAVAVNNRGKESQWSNIFYFFARRPIIADSAEEENVEILKSKNEDNLMTEDEDSPVIDIRQENEAKIENTEEKIDKKKNRKEIENSGLINEGNEKQNKLSPNLIVFIIFLISIIGWIIWVNRELAKEQKEQEKKNNKPNENISLFSEEKNNDLQQEKK
ncbi:MAG: hypothetical protein WC582_01110 [Patescibacteria group bacterium]